MDAKKSNRIIIPGKDLTENILNNFGLNISNLPMIVNPVKWEININTKSDVGKDKINYKIVTYGGYFYNKEEKTSFFT